MLLGFRVRQKSILWPLVAVMLPGWLVLISLVRRPETGWHTQMALRERVAQQMLAYDVAGEGLIEAQRAKIESLYERAHRAGLIKDPQLVDEAVVWLRLGNTDRTVAALDQVKVPKTSSHYFDLTQKATLGKPLAEEDKEQLRTLLAKYPDDWWVHTLAELTHSDLPRDTARLEQRRHWAAWRLRLADGLLPALTVVAVLLALPALKLLAGTWTVWPYSERVQRLWPLALMLCVLSLRGLLMLLGGSIAGIIVPMISWSGQRDPITVYNIQVCLGFFCNLIVLVGLTYGVKECVAAHWGSLGDVLGFERADFADRKLWVVAIPCSIALVFGLEPLPQLLESWHLGGASLFDSLGRSPSGYNGLGTCLSIVQAVVLAPLIEEAIYRGFLLSALRTAFGTTVAVLLSSLVFALAHGFSLTGTVMVFVYGTAYAGVKLHTGRLGAAMILHACVAAIVTTLSLLQGG